MSLSVLHRDKERFRHRKLHFILDSTANYVPNLPGKKETKVQKLRRIALYINFLTEVKKKCGLLNEKKQMDKSTLKQKKSYLLNKKNSKRRSPANIVFLGKSDYKISRQKRLEKEDSFESPRSIETKHWKNNADTFKSNEACDHLKCDLKNHENISSTKDEAYLKRTVQSQESDKLISNASSNPLSDYLSDELLDVSDIPLEKINNDQDVISEKTLEGTSISHEHSNEFGSRNMYSKNSAFTPYVKMLPSFTSFAYEANSSMASQAFCNPIPTFWSSPLPYDRYVHEVMNTCNSSLLNVDKDATKWPNVSDESLSNENLSATRYLLKNLSSGSSDFYERGESSDGDGFMENIQDFDKVYGSYEKYDGSIKTLCDDKILLSGTEVPNNKVFSDNFHHAKFEYHPFPYQNVVTEDNSQFIASNDYFVPQNTSFLNAENDDNWQFLVPKRETQTAHCSKNSCATEDFEPILTANEMSYSLNFINNQ